MIAAVNGYAFAAGLETALLADIRIAAENAEFGALERRWNIVGGDGMTVRLPLVVGFAKAMELIITGRRIDVERGASGSGSSTRSCRAAGRWSARRSWRTRSRRCPRERSARDKESVMRGVGRTLEERLRIEAEMTLSMFMRRDSHTIGAPRSRRRPAARVAAPRALIAPERGAPRRRGRGAQDLGVRVRAGGHPGEQ